ncbi:hypothetical protein FIU63_13115 [Enterococcus faecium]|nr:hypothetical protein FIU63_13115 [Enterococcus faecium]
MFFYYSTLFDSRFKTLQQNPISDLLDVEEGDPMFYFHTQGFSLERLPVEYSISKYRGDINYFVFELAQ